MTADLRAFDQDIEERVDNLLRPQDGTAAGGDRQRCSRFLLNSPA
jgi:hypothetical protein